MITYKTQQCQHCHGKGKVRFLLFFGRDCPECNGTGQIQVPQITQQKETWPFAVSALNPETLAIVKAKPSLLHCLSPANQADLMRKHSELRHLPPRAYGIPAESEAEQRRRNEEMMQAEENRRRFADFVRQSQEQHKQFMEWSHKQQQQAQQQANQLFQNYVKEHRRY